MFAPRIAKTPARTQESQNADSVGVRPASKKTIAQGAISRVTWDFSKIPIFSPDIPSRTRPPVLSAVSTARRATESTLAIAPAEDPLEHEADRVANEVMRLAHPELSGAAASSQLSRPSPAHRDQGQPLDAAARTFFERSLGHDFSRVRVHTDGIAAASARAVGALAYAVGHDLVFADAQFAPGTAAGDRLLAHELAHVRQAERGQGSPAVLRRQGSPTRSATTADPQPSKVKQLVGQKDPTAGGELSMLLTANALDNKPAAAAGPVTAGGATHKWVLRVELKRADLDRTGAIRGKTDPESVTTIPAKTKTGTPTTVHEIHIAINKWLGSSPEEMASHPDLQERMNYMAAETLLHELIHARIAIDRAMASLGVAASSTVGAELQQLEGKRQVASAQEATLRARVTSLIVAAGNAVGKPVLTAANMSTFVDVTISDLLEEKFAKQKAGQAFGLTTSIANAAVADAYGDKVERAILQLAIDVDFTKGNALKTNKLWNDQIADLKLAITAFYDKIDRGNVWQRASQGGQATPQQSTPPESNVWERAKQGSGQ